MRAAIAARPLAALCLVLASGGSALAADAEGRSWEALKAEIEARVERGAYPVMGLKAEDVREALAEIGGLDRDAWARGWMRTGERYLARARSEEASEPKAARAD